MYIRILEDGKVDVKKENAELYHLGASKTNLYSLIHVTLNFGDLIYGFS